MSKKEIKLCNFRMAWVGECLKPSGKNDKCDVHSQEKCVSCGKQATHTCDETGQFVCGAPLCDDCEHTTAQDGTNGNIGFYRSSPLPDGMHEHCKKSEQKYFSWMITSIGNEYPEIQAILDKFNKKELSYLDADNQINEFIEKKY